MIIIILASGIGLSLWYVRSKKQKTQTTKYLYDVAMLCYTSIRNNCDKYKRKKCKRRFDPSSSSQRGGGMLRSQEIKQKLK